MGVLRSKIKGRYLPQPTEGKKAMAKVINILRKAEFNDGKCKMKYVLYLFPDCFDNNCGNRVQREDRVCSHCLLSGRNPAYKTKRELIADLRYITKHYDSLLEE